MPFADTRGMAKQLPAETALPAEPQGQQGSAPCELLAMPISSSWLNKAVVYRSREAAAGFRRTTCKNLQKLRRKENL